jgi:outer membrane lipopolysaccharide assembly protein LptE/RlpB
LYRVARLLPGWITTGVGPDESSCAATRASVPASMVATRSYTYDETQVLGKAQEERILRRALAEDLARQIVRRIEAVGGADVSVVPRG